MSSSFFQMIRSHSSSMKQVSYLDGGCTWRAIDQSQLAKASSLSNGAKVVFVYIDLQCGGGARR